jgi:2-dehydropantoate 2-reductase
MKICFFGVGGVGGYFGTLVTKRFQKEHDIYFIARGAHKDVIIKNGLTLKKAGGNEIISVSPKLCTDKPEELPICDIIILSVKSYDLASVAKEISKISNDKTIILPLLNGVDIYDRIRDHLSKGIVLPSCVYVGTHIESQGIIFQKGGSCKISIGKDPAYPNFYPEPLLNLLKGSEIDFDWEENVEISIWSKFMFIAAFGLVTAAFNKTLGEILEDSELSKKTKSIMCEIYEIAHKLNIPLNQDIVETSFLKAKQFPYEAKTSFQRDVESKGKINEGDLFGGTLIRYGTKLDIATPESKNVFQKLLRKFE